MFFTLAILSMLGYATQNALLAHYARKMDGLSLAVYRNLSLGISMLPLLIFAPSESYALLGNFKWEIFWAAFLGAASLPFSFSSVRFLPVGIATAFKRSTTVIFLLLLGFLIFGEVISSSELIFVTIIIICAVLLSVQDHWMAHLDKRTTIGISLCVLSSFLASLSFINMGKIAKELDPFLAGYIWETMIGVFALFMAIGSQIFSSYKLTKISKKEFGIILAISSPTLIGTGCFAYALTLGPIGILGAIGATSIFVIMLMSHFLYGEALNKKQWSTIAVMVIGIVGLKLVG